MDPSVSPSSSKSSASKPRKRFVGSKSAKPSQSGVSQRPTNQIPEDILDDARLAAAISLLPSNYSFEIHKTIHHVRKNGAKMVALQMPEGLQMFACTIADIIERFTDALTVIMGDVTYGACCIDDYTAVALGCDMLVHYGHSCLVPIDQTSIKTLYVFVEIAIDSSHLEHSVRLNFPSDRARFRESLLEDEEEGTQTSLGAPVGRREHLRIENPPPGDTGTANDGENLRSTNGREPTRLALVSTIQFVAALQRLKEDLSVEKEDATPMHASRLPIEAHETSEAADQISAAMAEDKALGHPKLWTGAYVSTIPRSKPLSPGEILGCTAPRLDDVDALIYLGDGRFHLESIMIANPTVPAFRYDPYSKKFTRERYDHAEMRTLRGNAVQAARKSIASNVSSIDGDKVSNLVEAPHANGRGTSEAPLWGLVLGTLGRQGSFKQLQAITGLLERSNTSVPYMPILLSELSPAKLALFNPHISTFVQTSCPRLSIDWGYAFDRPLLSPYEVCVAVGAQAGNWMDEDPSKDKEDPKVGYPMDFYEAGTPWALSRAKGAF